MLKDIDPEYIVTSVVHLTLLSTWTSSNLWRKNSTSWFVEPDRGLAHYEGSRWFWGHHLSRNWPARFLPCFEHPQRVRRYIAPAEINLPKYLSATPAGCPLGLSLKVSLWVFSRPPKYKRSPSRPTTVTQSFTNEESTSQGHKMTRNCFNVTLLSSKTSGIKQQCGE